MGNITWALLQVHRDKGLMLSQDNAKVVLYDPKGNEITSFVATDDLELTHIWHCATNWVKYYASMNPDFFGINVCSKEMGGE